MNRIPDVVECCRLMEHYEMLRNIRRHSFVVAGVARQIVNGLHEREDLPCLLPDQDLIVAGALLHDIAKTSCLRDGRDHARVGGEICLSHGYTEISRIVAEHVLLESYNQQRNSEGVFTARDIVYYADKRVRHDEIVSLEERLDYILDKYGRDDPQLHDRIRTNFSRCERLEQHLFSYLPFEPVQLAEAVLRSSTMSVLHAMTMDEIAL